MNSFAYWWNKESLMEHSQYESTWFGWNVSNFFKKKKAQWDLVKIDINNYFHEFFAIGFLLIEINETIIIFLRKKNQSTSISHFWTINLCNVVCKIISKNFLNRMRHLLSKIISPFQEAFVPERWISKNTILAQELIHSKKKKQGIEALMGIKIDMNKTYVKIEWNLIM